MQISRRKLLQAIVGSAVMAPMTALSASLPEMVDIDWLDALRLTIVADRIDPMPARDVRTQHAAMLDLFKTMIDRPTLAAMSIRGERVRTADDVLDDGSIIVQIPDRHTLVVQSAKVVEKTALGRHRADQMLSQHRHAPILFIRCPMTTIVAPRGNVVLTAATSR